MPDATVQCTKPNMEIEIYEGSEADIGLMPAIFVAGMLHDFQWSTLMRDVKVEDWLAWQVECFKIRWKLPDKRLFLAKDVATGKVVGYAVLALPGKWSEEQIKESSGVAPMPEGANQVLLEKMVKLIGISKNCGYDPTVHYHRKGIAVLPEYQRKGVASKLSQRLDEIVDEVGGTTYVVTVPASMMLFKSLGYEIIGTEVMDMTTPGGTPVEEKNYVLIKRHGKSKDTSSKS